MAKYPPIHGPQARLGRLQRAGALHDGRPVALVQVGAHMAIQGLHGTRYQFRGIGEVARGGEQPGNRGLVHGTALFFEMECFV